MQRSVTAAQPMRQLSTRDRSPGSSAPTVARMTRCVPIPVATLVAVLLAAAPAHADWIWPVRGDVITPYRNGDDPYAAGQHRGIDIAAAPGTPVVAAAGGEVRFAGTAGSSGLTVSIRTRDGRYDTSYLHLSAAFVRRGRPGGGRRARRSGRHHGRPLGSAGAPPLRRARGRDQARLPRPAGASCRRSPRPATATAGARPEPRARPAVARAGAGRPPDARPGPGSRRPCGAAPRAASPSRAAPRAASRSRARPPAPRARARAACPPVSARRR